YDPARPGYFSYDETTVTSIRARNPSLADAVFHTVRDPARPYLIAHASVIGPTQLSPFTALELVGMEYTPLYVGTPLGRPVTYTSQWRGTSEVNRVGGGLLEPFAFGGSAPVHTERDLVDVLPPERPFALSNVLGTATASNALSYNN